MQWPSSELSGWTNACLRAHGAMAALPCYIVYDGNELCDPNRLRGMAVHACQQAALAVALPTGKTAADVRVVVEQRTTSMKTELKEYIAGTRQRVDV